MGPLAPPAARRGGEVGCESRTAEVSSTRPGLEGARRVGRSEHEAGQRAGPRKVHELPPRRGWTLGCPLVKDAEDTVEVRRFDQLYRQSAYSAALSARVAVRSPHPAHDGAPQPKGPPTRRRTRNRAPHGRSRRAHRPGELRHLRHTAVQPLNLCHRAHGASPFRHGIVSSTRPLPIRTNITRPGKPLKGVRHNMRPNPPPGWTGQQRRSTRNRRGVTTVPASVSPAKS